MFADIKIIIFDLDNTLHDYSHSSNTALGRIFDGLTNQYQIPKQDLEIAYADILKKAVANVFVDNKTSYEYRKERFTKLLQYFDLDHTDELLDNLLDIYESELRKNTKPSDNLHEILHFLSSNRKLYLATEGPEDAQLRTIEWLNISDYFTDVFTSNKTRKRKSTGDLFEYVVSKIGCNKKEVVVVGDSYSSDILGAKKAGLTPIWLNLNGKKIDSDNVVQIKKLDELRNLLC